MKFKEWLHIQHSLLSAHPKIKGFITHGGLLGIQESISYGVPMILFPIYGDQDYNAGNMELKNVGIKLEITSVTENQLESAIQAILTNST